MGKSYAPGPIPPYRQTPQLHSGDYYAEQSKGWGFMLKLGVACILAAAAGFVWILEH